MALPVPVVSVLGMIVSAAPFDCTVTHAGGVVSRPVTVGTGVLTTYAEVVRRKRSSVRTNRKYRQVISSIITTG